MRSLIILLPFVCACLGTPSILQFARNYDPTVIKPFDLIPSTLDAAVKEGYEKVRECGKSKFIGNAYIRNQDPSFTLLFAENGDVAGVQFAVTELPLSESLLTPFVKDDNLWKLTFYFTSPATLCQQGRPQSAENDYQLYLQISDSATTSIPIALKEKELDLSKWTKGSCVPGVGVHYLLKLVKDDRCDTRLPVFAIFDNGKLVGVGYSLLSTTLPIAPVIPQVLTDLFLGTVSSSCKVKQSVVSDTYFFFELRSPASVSSPGC